MGLKNNKKYFEGFVKKLLVPIDEKLSREFKIPEKEAESTELIAKVLHEISGFIYTQTTNIRGVKCETPYGLTEYFYEFHKF